MQIQGGVCIGTTDHGCVLLKQFSTVVPGIIEECFKKQPKATFRRVLNGFGAVLDWGSGNLNATF